PQRVDPASVRVPAFLPDTPTVRADIARQYDNLAVLDAWVGELLDELDDAGLRDSTYVFFFTDHGDGLPRHKRWVYDSGTRVPLLVRYPDGHRAGEVDRGLVSFLDLAPTALAIAGVERPAYLRGRVIAGPDTAPAPEHVFMHRDRMDDASFETIRSVRTERFRYVRNYRPELPYLQPVAYRDRAKTLGEI
ncbi:MAG: sulfatase-like hydrolase/transferase, partial [Actinomycetota bacterium]